ncbi:hypothetical protein Bbelb_011000 [Branchiostoma belcheri]|nr:hypothetical protein Bbelb_011000 [Branchiostoma belcheri]
MIEDLNLFLWQVEQGRENTRDSSFRPSGRETGSLTVEPSRNPALVREIKSRLVAQELGFTSAATTAEQVSVRRRQQNEKAFQRLLHFRRSGLSSRVSSLTPNIGFLTGLSPAIRNRIERAAQKVKGEHSKDAVQPYLSQYQD